MGIVSGVSSGPRAYVDESSSISGATQEYLLCGTVVNSDEEYELRSALRELLLPGQTKFHWTKEKRARRHLIIDVISRSATLHFVVSHTDEARRNDERYRRKCLERLYRTLEHESVENLVLESRSTRQNLRDRQHIIALQTSGDVPRIRILHVPGRVEPLLWISDAILGAINAARLGDTQFMRRLNEHTMITFQSTSS